MSAVRSKRSGGRSQALGSALGPLCVLALAAAVLLPVLAGLGFAAGGDALPDRVLGQPSLSSNSANNGGLSVGLYYPYGVAIGPDGRLFVADYANNRVLSWPSVDGFANGQGAELVLGQNSVGNGGANYSGVNEYGLSRPSSLTVDGSGRLYVVDRFNNRVLRYSPPFVTGKGADLVLGQPNFNSNAPQNGALGANARLASWPWGVVVDRSSGRLFVSDHENHRVLIWASVDGLTNGQGADIVLGQPDFNGNAYNVTWSSIPTDRSLYYPSGLAVDAATGRLFVGDYDNERVLRFTPPFATYMQSDLVLGQPNHTSYGGAVSDTRLYKPRGVAVDSGGNVFVADSPANRVLRYNAPSANGQAADLVLGQTLFTTANTNNGGLAGGGLYAPNGVAVDGSGHLVVADTYNHRVLVYDGLAAESMAGTSLSAGAATGTYGGSATLSATLTSGGPGLSGKSVAFSINGSAVGSATTDGSGVATLGGASLAGIGAGTYPSGVSASFAGDSDHGSSAATAALVVEPAPLTITTDNKTKAYGAALPALTASYSGFVAGDTEASLSTPPALATTATAASDVSGSPYAITASGAVAANYNIAYAPGTLTITPAPAGIRYSGVTRVYAGSPISMTAVVTQAVPGFAGTLTSGAAIFAVTDGVSNNNYGPEALSAAGVATKTIPAGLASGVYSVTAQLDPAAGNFAAPPFIPVGIVVADPANTLRAVQYASGSPSPGYSLATHFFSFWQRVLFRNTGTTLAKNVRAYIRRVAANTTVDDDYVWVGDIAPGASRWSSDSFKLTVDLWQQSYRCDSFAWRVLYEDASNNPQVANPVPQYPPGLAPGGCR